MNLIVEIARWIEKILGLEDTHLGITVLYLFGLLIVLLGGGLFRWIGKKIDQRALECGLVTQAQLDKEERERIEASLRRTPDSPSVGSD